MMNALGFVKAPFWCAAILKEKNAEQKVSQNDEEGFKGNV